jgi:UDP-N-acetylmuramyl pentapeptide phosphotransferase/UDP-N-acetylglucosamine-1-phosphate transferase
LSTIGRPRDLSRCPLASALPLVAAVVALVVSFLLTRAFTHPGSRLHILDHPNERSLHTTPTPRTGGVAIVIGLLAGGIFLFLVSGVGFPRELRWLGGLAVLIASVSYLDDRRHIPVGYRLATHLVASVLLVIAGLTVGSLSLPGIAHPIPAWLAGVLTVLFAVWMVNLYNFMDGMDGFAGGMTVFGFGTLALLGWWGGDHDFAAVNLIIAGGAAGFLIFNFPPAKIFMGDAGSSTLGFLAAGMSLWANASGLVPLWISVLVFSPFIVDATVTLFRRLIRREKVWQAHKTHYYQRLVQANWGHRKTVLVEYGLMVACAAGALTAYRATAVVQWAIITGAILLYVVFFRFVRATEVSVRRHPSSPV